MQATHWKNIVVMGAGESGQGAALLAIRKGYKVWLSDASRPPEEVQQWVVQENIPHEWGQHTESRFLEADAIIASPGIPDTHPLLEKCLAQGIPVISEIEWAGLHTRATIVAITGTNGKTTTTALTHHVLKNAGLDAGLAGNIGYSFARALAERDREVFVLEVSSFQLDRCFTFRPHVAVITNITPDHLDRYHQDYNLYIRAKMRIFQNQTASDHLVVCNDSSDLVRAVQSQNPSATVHWYGNAAQPAPEAYFNETQLTLKYPPQEIWTMYLQELALQGRHNYYNSLAAALTAKILGVRKEIIRESFMDFKGVEHRMEYVATVRGIDFINDSKATNVNSAFYALESMNKPVIWIAGGRDKGNDYTELKPVVKQKVKAIVVLGEGYNKIRSAFGELVPQISAAENMAEAVKKAYRLGTKGDVVLLSPASASFDLFRNYEDRGNQFKFFVREL
ncbi:MAG: UDP-N-acetylmuramoyl-L-alanine--D-glutamate ligase [Flavobacteriales bacterium]|nr:UDP-N-acetylmuramoyl-L-alanine--D-glutamate ligase [Flavobacteriales bacterium]MCX7649959.1 UDP-N-acetylmuramoyl-L-alanine--D-glutamate ligase [Flavobacteriales bacterium]MDW8432318.1 UDP-N-acetylmuramoyl-L-alanine--D-glutamate ligase [Flavobacteriales bacterium]